MRPGPGSSEHSLGSGLPACLAAKCIAREEPGVSMNGEKGRVKQQLTKALSRTSRGDVRRDRNRLWQLLQLSGAIVLLVAGAAFGFAATVGADEPSSGQIVSTAAQPNAGFTADTPFSSGQVISVVIPANTAFAGSNANINVIECSAPNGVVPTDPSNCDGNTIQGDTILPNADGSFSYSTYTLFALPDPNFESGGGGPACGLTAATECILYIGNNQNDFTAPHLWSQPFFINGHSGSDAGTSPGDGSAPPVATTPSASLSTVGATPTTVTADGVDQSSVTVTLNATGPIPVSGKTVALACTASCGASITPASAVSDANGQATFTVTDTTTEAVTLQATDTTDSLIVTQTAGVTFAAPVVSATHSTVSASPMTAGSTTITVTLRDQGTNPQPVAGQSVTLAGTGSSVVDPTTAVVTNASGVATFTATDPAAETVTFTATDTTTNTVIANTAQVTFGTLTVSASQSTVTADSPATLTLGTTVVVTLLSDTHSPVSGKTVTLQASSGTAVIGAPSPATSGADGKVSFTLHDTVAESVTVTATDTTDSVTLTPTATVVFDSGGSPSATTSAVTAQSATAPADGTTQTLITVVLNDQFGQPVSGKTITLQGAPTGNVESHPIAVGSSTPGITDSSGTAEFEALDSHAETVTFTATDTTDSLPLTQTVTITFVPGSPDPTAIGTTVAADPVNPPADGTSPSTITVTLTDHFSNPVSGKTVSLAALSGSSVITAVSAVTDATGVATFKVTDAKTEFVTYQATDVTDGNRVLESEATVKFGDAPSPPAVAAGSDVTAAPSSVPADGTSAATISVLLFDANGVPAAGKTVTLSASAGGSTVAATNATSDTTGTATFAVTDTTPETVTYTADDTSDSLDLTGNVVTVTFTAAAATATTTTTTAPTGATTTTVAGGVALNSTSGGSTGNTGSVSTGSGSTGSGSTGSTLAETGASALLPWLVALGGLCIVVGTVGRRRFRGRTP